MNPLFFKALAPNFYWIPGSEGWIERFSAHSYLFLGKELNLLVDPGSSLHEQPLKETLKNLDVSVDRIIVTHEHWDHVVASDVFPEAEKAASVHGIDAINQQIPEVVRHTFHDEHYTSQFTGALKDGEQIDLGHFQLEILLTPGHTRGSLCIYEPNLKVLLTGDTFFANGSISRIFKEAGGSHEEHVRTLERIKKLEVERGLEAIYPGHGDLIQGREACQSSIASSLDMANQELGI